MPGSPSPTALSRCHLPLWGRQVLTPIFRTIGAWLPLRGHPRVASAQGTPYGRLTDCVSNSPSAGTALAVTERVCAPVPYGMGHLFPAKQGSERTFPVLGKVPKEHLKGQTAFFPFTKLPATCCGEVVACSNFSNLKVGKFCKGFSFPSIGPKQVLSVLPNRPRAFFMCTPLSGTPFPTPSESHAGATATGRGDGGPG